jgi:serine protease AprX
MSTTYAADKDPYSLFQSQQDLGARAMWGQHFTGDNTDVALIDSGVTPVAGLDAPGKVIYGPDLTEESQNPATANLDTYGHGTFMAGIIAGHDAGVDAAKQQGSPGPFMGYAPDARIVSVKVADAHGATDVSQVLAGIDWVVQHAHDPGMNIRVLNLSFGTDASQPYTLDPLAYAAEIAWRAGIVVVVSAGNSGTTTGHLTLPAYDPFVLAVGAADTNSTAGSKDDTIPTFSSRGDGVRNPDVVLPGVHVQSLRVQGSYIDSQFPGGVINDRFFRGSGTSEAAAAASGAVALLIDQHPTATPDQLKALVKNTATTIPNVDSPSQGNGLVNLRKAVTTKLIASSQTFTPSTGTGSLDASRGSSTLVLNGVALTGERDIMGTAVDTAALAQQEANGTAWSGGVWNGVRWSGDNWTGVRWSGAVWSGSDWTGVRWSSNNWSSGTWDGVRWSNTTWSGTAWDGVRWSGMRWSGDIWSGEGWS